MVSSSFTSSPTSLFPPWHFFGGLHPHPDKELAVAGCSQDKENTFPSVDKTCSGVWWRQGCALKCAIEWEALREKCARYFARYLTQAASQNWWWCQWYAVLYGKGFVAVCRLLYLQMVADSKNGNYILGSAMLLAFRYVVWSGVRCSLMYFKWCICTGNLNSYLSFLSVLISAAKVGIWSYFSVICLALKASFPIWLSLAQAVGPLPLVHVFI